MYNHMQQAAGYFISLYNFAVHEQVHTQRPKGENSHFLYLN